MIRTATRIERMRRQNDRVRLPTPWFRLGWEWSGAWVSSDMIERWAALAREWRVAEQRRAEGWADA